MTKKKREIIFSSILVIIIFTLVAFNTFVVEKTKAEEKRMEEELTRIEYEKAELKKAEIEMLEQKLARESLEIIEFDEKYRVIKNEYIKKVNELSEKIDSGILNIDELKDLTIQKMDVSRKFKRELNEIDIPESLKDFYDFEMEFLNNDIETMVLVLAYYNGNSYSTYDDNELKKLYRKADLLIYKAKEELRRVYSQYGLEYLLEELL